MKLIIQVKDGYLFLRLLGRTVQILVTPLLQRYTHVLDFDRDTGVLLLEAEFLFPNGTAVTEEDPLSLSDALIWAFPEPLSLIREIRTITLE